MPINKPKFKPRWRLVLTALSLVLVLSGCASSSDSPDGAAENVGKEGKVFHVASDMDQIVKDAIAEFPKPLPAGVGWFTKAPEDLKKANTQYEEGVAEGVVSFYWLCAWEKSFLDSFETADQEVQDTSLSMVEKFVELPWYQANVLDPEKAWLADVVVPAKLGDASGMKKDYSTSCSRFESLVASS